MFLGRDKNYLVLSFMMHVFIMSVLVLGLDLSTPIPVIEQGNENSIINAVVLGDSPKSKIIREDSPPPEPAPKVITKPSPPEPAKQKAIPIEPLKKQAKSQSLLEEKKRHDLLAIDLLNELEKQTKKKAKALEDKKKYEKALREKSEQTLRQQLLDDELKLKSKLAIKAKGEINKYKALILQVISEHWIIPTGVNKKLYCELMIRLAPGGLVLSVDVTKSSGDPALDSSARVAVLKASPLPVPKDPDAFKAFKSFLLKVKPENILAGQ